MKRYKLDPQTGDAMLDANGDAIEESAPEAAKPRDQVAFLGSEKLGKLAADMFPRVAQGAVSGRGALGQAGAGLLDALSLLGRGLDSSGPAPDGASWKDGNPALGDTQGSTLPGRIMRDPGTGAALLAAPFTGGVSLTGLGGVGLRGALTGLASASAHQGENVLEGKGVQPLGAAGEIAANAAIPVLGSAAAPLVKGAGVKIFNSIVKPSKAALKAGYDTEKFLGTGLGGGGLTGAQHNIEDRIDQLADQIEEIITGKSRQATVTTKAEAFAGDKAPTGMETTGGTVAEPGLTGLPQGEALKQIGPSVIPMGTPKPKFGSAEPMITPNPNPVPARIDPRFAKPFATSTSNQAPIQNVTDAQGYGIAPDRNLPVPAAGAPGVPAAPGRGFQLGPDEPLTGGPSAPGRQPLGQLPPGAPPDNVIDISKKVNLLDALNSTKRGLGQELSSGEHAGHAEDIGSGAAQWLSDLEARGMAGDVTPKNALTYQRGVGAMGKFDNGQNPQLVPPKARVANKLYGNIGDRLQEIAPEIGPLRKEISDLIPARMAMTDAAARTDKNFAIGLREAMAAAGALHGAAVNGPAGALPGLGLAGAIRAASSPRIGNALFNAGNSLAEKSTVRDAIKQMLLQTLYGPGDNQSP